MFIIEMNQQDINNLKVFLSRVNLTGEEVPAFNMIIKSVYDAKPKEGEEPKKAGE